MFGTFWKEIVKVQETLDHKLSSTNTNQGMQRQDVTTALNSGYTKMTELLVF